MQEPRAQIVAKERRPKTAARPDAAVAVAPGAATPMRRCIVTREVLPRHALLRLAIGPDGELVPDVAARLPGRGLWMTPRRELVAAAIRKSLFAKACGQPVLVPVDLADRIEQLLVRRILEFLGLARRAGQVANGFEKVRERLAQGRVGLLLEASDGAADGKRKLRALAPDVPVVELFDAAELGRALGRDPAVHVAVAPGRLADRIRLEVDRLAGMRAAQETDGSN